MFQLDAAAQMIKSSLSEALCLSHFCAKRSPEMEKQRRLRRSKAGPLDRIFVLLSHSARPRQVFRLIRLLLTFPSSELIKIGAFRCGRLFALMRFGEHFFSSHLQWSLTDRLEKDEEFDIKLKVV